MRTRPSTTIALIVAAAPAAFGAQTPAEAIAAGRAAIAAKQFDRAIITMQDAIPAATMLSDPKEKAAALAAIHFYSALAFSELERDDKTKEELREFFRFRQGDVKLDETRYPVPFIRAFNEVVSTIHRNGGGNTPQGAPSNSFDIAYPGFNEFVLAAPRERKISEWNKSPDFVLLATEQEKRTWGKLADDEARRSFVARFWQRRDADFRIEFDRRVAFADGMFANEKTRGSLTDRGRVFVLVGKPYRVIAQPLVASRVLPSRLGDLNNRQGTIEHWFYTREQLPVPLPRQSIDFVFIDAPDYGDYILQRDGFSIKELEEVKKKHSGE